jgi:hypothetical protein
LYAILIQAALFLAGMLALAGFAWYICRGRPATPWLGRRQARDDRTLQEIERHLLAETKITESDHPHEID